MSIYDLIREKIIIGAYKPGDRLTEEALAHDFNTSRTPVREAVMQLQNEGLITPLKRGMKVTKYTKEDVWKIYGLRILLEGEMAYQAAIYRTEEHISLLKKANEEYHSLLEIFNKNQDKEIIKKAMQINHSFHKTLGEATNNEYIGFLLSKVVIDPLVYQSLYWYNKSRLEQSVIAHENITKAIINKDGARAKSAMHEHMYQGRDTVLAFIED
ncbi:GntR family transcriptional regulator [Halalkalibacter oceani]|uniref:GntR family transcriptional regulator n=1 Tax=Halalkalibacter oceani TaxID=1653776 RepID=UPI00339B2B9E